MIFAEEKYRWFEIEELFKLICGIWFKSRIPFFIYAIFDVKNLHLKYYAIFSVFFHDVVMI